jgi:hypothetical protein
MIRPLRLTFALKLTLSLALLLSCNEKKNIKRQNGIHRIVFATGGCFGPCPVQVFDIDSSLSVKYCGIKNANLKGFYRGNITQELWDSINIKFESINYNKLDSAYNHSVDDLTTELIIYNKSNKVKYIMAQSSSLPDSVGNVYNWLLRSLNNLNLITTKDSLTFPTYLDRPPIRTVIKFLPPKN